MPKLGLKMPFGFDGFGWCLVQARLVSVQMWVETRNLSFPFWGSPFYCGFFKGVLVFTGVPGF